jgi:hypothetical protein
VAAAISDRRMRLGAAADRWQGGAARWEHRLGCGRSANVGRVWRGWPAAEEGGGGRMGDDSNWRRRRGDMWWELARDRSLT